MMDRKTEVNAGYAETFKALDGAWKRNPNMNESSFKATIQEHFLGKSQGKSNEFQRGAQVAVDVFIQEHRRQVESNEYNQSLGQAVGW